MRLMLLLTFFLALGCVALPPGEDKLRAPATYSELGEVGQATISKAHQLTFAKFRELVVASAVGTVEDVLPALHARHAEYLQFHTLMYDSFSIQHASFEEPRAIVFGPQAEFVFSFNGGVHHKGGNAFETMEYDRTRHAFQFREILFKKQIATSENIDLRAEEIEFENDKVIVSRANPAKCLQCHGANASPIWQTYFMWPGAYGSNDDQLSMSFDSNSWNGNNEVFFQVTQRPNSQGRQMVFRPRRHDVELEGLVRYTKAKPRHPRYRWLPARVFEDAALAYAAGASFAEANFARRAQEISERTGNAFGWPSRPNLFLLTALERLNSDRLKARFAQAELQGAFSSPQWSLLARELPDSRGETVIPEMTARIGQVLASIPRMKGPVDPKVIRTRLIQNLREEYAMQRERIYRQDVNLGRNALVAHPGYLLTEPGKVELQPPQTFRGIGFFSLDTSPLYDRILGLNISTELDRIALSIETDDQFRLTSVDLLLRASGIDLRDYTMNLRQFGLTFHSDGIEPALKYLGIPPLR